MFTRLYEVCIMQIAFDEHGSCEFCGKVWTEESTLYNGGCCKEDEKHDPDRRAVLIEAIAGTMPQE
jgi:hypothetical protein